MYILFSVNGSVGFLFKFLERFVVTVSQTIHGYHIDSHEYETVCLSSGSGYFHVFIENNSRDFLILEISEILLESLAGAEYHCNDINAIVHRIASIVITTISSTKVNHLEL